MAASSSAATTRLGEVVETSTTLFVAESDQLHLLPELGSLVRVNVPQAERSVYGIVAYGQTGGLDSGRRAVRRGSQELVDEAIYHQHPELQLVLRTLFAVAVIGWRDGLISRHSLPALPAPLHYSVYACSHEEVATFCAEPRYFPTLLAFSGDVPPEALIAAHLRWVDATLSDGHAWLHDAARRLARLMKRDYDRLVTILQGIDLDE